MGRQIAISSIEIMQSRRKQGEVLGFFGANKHPVVKEIAWKVGVCKPDDDIPGEIDRVQLDMRERMQKCDPSGRAAIDFSARDIGGVQQGGFGRSGRPVGNRGSAVFGYFAATPEVGDIARLLAFFMRVCR